MDDESPQPNAPLVQPDTEQAKLDLEKWRIEEDLKVRREELEIKRKDLPKTVWSSPLLIAVIGVCATVVASLVQNYVQSEANRNLERQRFESTLIQKALETESSDEAAKRLSFLVNLGFITDENGKIANYVKKPDTIPLQPTGNSLASACPPNLNNDLHNCPDEGCGVHFDPSLNKLKNITSSDQSATTRPLGFLQQLPEPANFKEGESRSELSNLGEG